MSDEHERTEHDETEPQATPDEQPSEPKTISRRKSIFWIFAALGAAILAGLGHCVWVKIYPNVRQPTMGVMLEPDVLPRETPYE